MSSWLPHQLRCLRHMWRRRLLASSAWAWRDGRPLSDRECAAYIAPIVRHTPAEVLAQAERLRLVKRSRERCLRPHCKRRAQSGGLCPQHLESVTSIVASGRQTWSEAEQRGYFDSSWEPPAPQPKKPDEPAPCTECGRPTHNALGECSRCIERRHSRPVRNQQPPNTFTEVTYGVNRPRKALRMKRARLERQCEVDPEGYWVEPAATAVATGRVDLWMVARAGFDDVGRFAKIPVESGFRSEGEAEAHLKSLVTE